MKKHTPGPWRADVEIHKTIDGDFFPKDGSVCVMTDKGNFDWEVARIHKTSGGDGSFKENCFLMAAAPDLLKAADEVMEAHSSGHTSLLMEALKKLEKAIIKAKDGSDESR